MSPGTGVPFWRSRPGPGGRASGTRVPLQCQSGDTSAPAFLRYSFQGAQIAVLMKLELIDIAWRRHVRLLRPHIGTQPTGFVDWPAGYLYSGGLRFEVFYGPRGPTKTSNRRPGNLRVCVYFAFSLPRRRRRRRWGNRKHIKPVKNKKKNSYANKNSGGTSKLNTFLGNHR